MAVSTHHNLALKARKIYHDRLHSELETRALGQFVAIEVDSGDYFLGATPLEAIDLGEKKYPQKLFHVMKVGSKATFILKRGSI